MLSRAVGALNKSEWYDRIFKNFHPNKNIPKNTLLFYNLESPLTLGSDTDYVRPGYIFKAHQDNIQVLHTLWNDGTMLLSLANNHITNAQWEWIDSTIALLKQYNIWYVWVGKNTPWIYKAQIANIQICVGAYSYDGGIKILKNKENIQEKYYINEIVEKNIKQDIRKMKQQKCEIKIISLHWGREYLYKPSKTQIKLAHNIIDAWADLIVGHHSHIPGKIELYKGKFIYYSLWNFIFDQDWWSNYSRTDMSTRYDGTLKRYTVPTYIGNTYDHLYEKDQDGYISLKKVQNTQHRISLGALFPYTPSALKE